MKIIEWQHRSAFEQSIFVGFSAKEFGELNRLV